MKHFPGLRSITTGLLAMLLIMAVSLHPRGKANAQSNPPPPGRLIVANVVALDRPFFWNRLGAAQPNGMIFALLRDIVSTGSSTNLTPGNVTLRADKRPRPLVLRVNQGDYLQINFSNLLNSNAVPSNFGATTRYAGVHIMGLELVSSIKSDASSVGKNPSSLAAPGQSITYTYYAKAEGVFMLYSSAGEGLDQISSSGLFGSVNVQPVGAEYYRSQVSQQDFSLVVSGTNATTGLPLINYSATFTNKFLTDGTPLPVLNMLQTNKQGQLEEVYSDLTAIITGPNAGVFPNPAVSPSFAPNPVSPDRTEPFREFSIHYHAAQAKLSGVAGFQPFVQFHAANTQHAYAAGADGFALNYGTAGIGPEVVANRLGVGPMGNPDSVDLKFEEFFLSSWANGDPSMITDVPANTPAEILDESQNWQVQGKLMAQERVGNFPPIDTSAHATKVLYPDDPSNVYHSYMNDHVKFRILNTGVGQTHVHHLHAHQWLHSPNSDNGHYLDSQMITPGSAYTMEIVHGGSGNLNRTVGDSIFHCHFYTHFAQGMWALWRVHDVFEGGTYLDTNGIPRTDIPNRALPDGEITAGTPIPAIVPLPTLGMLPVPALVTLTNLPPGIGASRISSEGRRVSVLETNKNPGFPFYIPGVAGHRAPHPPLDFAWAETNGVPVITNGSKVYLDGGLPRHLVLNGQIFKEFHTRWDLTKDFVLYRPTGSTNLVDGSLTAFQLPEGGTPVEQVAMAAHAVRTNSSVTPSGATANYLLNGLPPINGAPFADPAPYGESFITRRYQGAAIQTDAVQNKKGWHYPQQRMLMLWGDVSNVVSGVQPPEPLFFRANSGEVVEYWHANLVPNYYELDDFQVRTPTDILGQHIHLVKFDVTASDGAGNGFNYEDGTLSPDEVRERIYAINKTGGLYAYDPTTQFANTNSQSQLQVQPAPAVFGEPPAGQDWEGAQVTIQRWYADPQLNNNGFDRTLRTVFTHDHFGPSTHQQAGLYAGLLIEPSNSVWYASETTNQFYEMWPGNTPPSILNYQTRQDGGPTSWQARIITQNPGDSYREFALEFQDLQLSYLPTSRSVRAATPPTNFVFWVTNSVLGGKTLVSRLANYTNSPPNSNTNLPVDLVSQFGNGGITLSTNAFVTASSLSTYLVVDPHNPPLPSPQDYDQYSISVPVTAGANMLVYLLNSMTAGWYDSNNAINAPTDPQNSSIAKIGGAPYPTLISMTLDGTYSLNYRNEPTPLRVNTNPPSALNLTGTAAQQAGDLGYVFSSITRFDPALNTQPLSGPIDSNQPAGFQFPQTPLSQGMQPTDPYTPLLRTYANDNVQVRTLVGGQLMPHSFQIEGVKWLYEPTYTNSGYRNVQGMSISEHFEMLFNVPPMGTGTPSNTGFADYLYMASSEQPGLINGNWGIMRAYNAQTNNLIPLPNNPTPGSSAPVNYQSLFLAAPLPQQRSYSVVAITASEALSVDGVTLNTNGIVYNANPKATVKDPDGIMYVQLSDLVTNSTLWHLKSGIVAEPLILRAAAGDWIQVALINRLNPTSSALQTNWSIKPSNIFGSVTASKRAGLNANMVSYDIAQGNGMNAGFNPDQTAGYGGVYTNYWYAGNLIPTNGTLQQVPMEFGTCNLTATDPVIQLAMGMVGALIIEPQGAAWNDSTPPRAGISVTNGTSVFKEFVALLQPNFLFSSMQAFNYRAEPNGSRYPANVLSQPPNAPAAPVGFAQQFSDGLTNSVRPVPAEPYTPIFVANAGDTVRFRVLGPGGGPSSQAFALHGHVWQEEPYETVNGQQQLGFNLYSQSLGSQQLAAYQPFDMLLSSAGGSNKISGDYLYHIYLSEDGGPWGIMRVVPSGAPNPPIILQPAQSTAKATPAYLPAANHNRQLKGD